MTQSSKTVSADQPPLLLKAPNRPRLGCFPAESHTEFRLFCPRARAVTVEIFDSYEQTKGKRYPMNPNGDDIWQITLEGDFVGKLYGYHIQPPADEFFYRSRNADFVIADPYSKAVVARNHYLQHPRSLITAEEPFNWEGTSFVSPDDIRDLVIYEAHIKDLTSHSSAGSRWPGTYRGFADPEATGGINHLKKMGVNAVELLPLHKFAYFEPPHNEPISDGIINTWNVYGRNYWGYMTSFFFAPETIYASDGGIEPGAVTGRYNKAARELKNLVKTLHKNNITVILDVVFNHVSQYDLNPFKLIDKSYYFRLTEDGHYLSHSGCGNDFKTEAPMSRQLIVDSILYWMKEYHIDGFRFDLANLIDRETLQLIRQEAEKINPNVVLIAEPWGGGYDPVGFSNIGWASWNDQIRNGVKGSDPKNSKGFIFGHWHWESSREGLENFLAGTLLGRSNGRYHTSAHAVNYLESHDGYTLGDFIRIGLNPSKADQKHDRDEIARLGPAELRTAKLAALYLMASQGVPLIHAGQEWARTKVVEPMPNIKDPYAGRLDHNSYEKDNATNYLDFSHARLNTALVSYYRGLIALRLSAPALRKAKPGDLIFWNYSDSLHVTLQIKGEGSNDPYDYIITLNGNLHGVHRIHLPAGVWEVVVSPDIAGNDGFDVVAEYLNVEPTAGYILRKKRS
ncbi:alpha-amylase family glycosyl hydrolase [Cyclonatronum proteinivorum]|nr:alpha-amylase family glycosyl hydrolase [Cyclonatronum proteinivorum]